MEAEGRRVEGGMDGWREGGREGVGMGEKREGWREGWIEGPGVINFQLTWNRNNLEGGVKSSSGYGVIRPELHSSVLAARLYNKRRHIAAISLDAVARSDILRPFLLLVTHV